MIHFAFKKKLSTAHGEMLLNVNCHFEQGAFVSIYGPSGAGKTSILRMLAGFMKPDEGFIKLNDETWFDAARGIHVKTQQRKIGFVFQDYALFPNMSVRENIAFAVQKKESADIVDELLDLTGLDGLAARNVQSLSGGQRQRVALARAIATRPLLLLLDEPLSAMDHTLRLQLQNTLREVHKRFQLTSLLVSHDMEEIIQLSDSVIHLEQGLASQITTPVAFFSNGQDNPSLTGNIVAMEQTSGGTTAVVLLKNRILKINTTGDNLPVKTGEKVEIIYNRDQPIIRKL